MSTLDFPPANYEVEDQLKRILATPRFRNASNPSAFLELVVKRALKGKKTTGRIVAQELFGSKFIPGESVDVRVTARNLRKTLEKYFEREGSNDVVIISFQDPAEDKSIKPVEGEAYTPRFCYNPKHETFIFLRVAYRCLEQPTYRNLDQAFKIFTDILDREPENIGAALGLAETLCKFAERHWINPSPVEQFTTALNLLERVRNRAEAYWRFWAVMAYLHDGTGKQELIASCYEKALSLDRISTESFIPYIAFLIESQRTDEALCLAQRYANERVEDSTAVAQYGQILVSVGRWDIGIGHLQAALAIDPGNYLAHETMAAVRFVQKDTDGVSVHLQALKLLCDPPSFSRIVTMLQNAEEQYGLKGCIAKLLAQ
jgi:tetratricopeptide (TPR) repeat protein